MNYKLLYQLEREENTNLKLEIENLKLELQDSKIIYDLLKSKKLNYMNKCEELEKAIKDLQDFHSARLEMNQALKEFQNKYIYS